MSEIGELWMKQRDKMRSGVAGKRVHLDATSEGQAARPSERRRETTCHAFSEDDWVMSWLFCISSREMGD